MSGGFGAKSIPKTKTPPAWTDLLVMGGVLASKTILFYCATGTIIIDPGLRVNLQTFKGCDSLLWIVTFDSGFLRKAIILYATHSLVLVCRNNFV